MIKRSFFVIVIFIAIITISCVSTESTSSSSSSSASSSTTSSNRNNSNTSDLFTIKESVSRDITGDITTYRMEIYNSGVVRNQITNSNGITTFSLIKKTSGNVQVNQFQVMYVGSAWVFYDSIQIKINERIFTFNISEPTRQVMGRGNVLEILTPVLTDEIINIIKNCSSIVVQVNGRTRGEPITIDSNGISAINNFY